MTYVVMLQRSSPLLLMFVRNPLRIGYKQCKDVEEKKKGGGKKKKTWCKVIETLQYNLRLYSNSTN